MRHLALILPFVLGPFVSACTLFEIPFVPGSGGAWSGTGGAASGGGGGHVTGGAWSVGSGADSAASTGGTFSMAGAGSYSQFVVDAGSRIVGIGVTDTHIYWLTHGTFSGDDLQAYSGTLCRMGIDGGPIEVGVQGIDRPVQFGMTDTAGYIWLQQSPSLDFSGFQEVDLEHGWSSPIDVGGSPPALFYAFEDKAYISHDLAEDSGVFEHLLNKEGRQVIWGMPTDIAVSGTHVYFSTEAGELFRAPLDDPSSTELLASNVTRGFELWNERVLLLGEDSLFALPQEGGARSVVVNLPPGPFYADLRVAGDRYFVSEVVEEYSSLHIHSGLVSRGDAEQLWVVSTDTAWLGMETQLYLASGIDLDRIELD
jgi:hypothetical protein